MLSVCTVQLKGLFLRLLMPLDFLSMAGKRRKRQLCFLQNTGVLNTALMFVSWSAAEGRTAAGTNAASWLRMVAVLVAGGGTVTSTLSPKAPPKLPVPSVHCRGTASGGEWSDKASEEKRG